MVSYFCIYACQSRLFFLSEPYLPPQSPIPLRSPVIPSSIPLLTSFSFVLLLDNQSHHHQYINSPIMHAAYLRTQADAPRGTDKHCHDCQKKFTIGVREHQCKRCLKPVCSDCGNFRREVFSSTVLQLKEHRVCKNCHQASSCIADCIKNEDLRFGQTRDSGRKWLKRMIVKPATFGTDSSQHSVFTKQAFASLWGSYSCQLRELVGMLTYKYKQEGVFQPVYSVFTTVVSAAPQFSFSQVIHLVVYVLCFCSEDKAALIVLFLLEIKQGEKDFRAMAFNYLRALPFKNELQKLEGYINYRLERYSDSFFVNCMTLQCSKALISKTFQKKSLQQSLIFFATHIYLNRDVLVSKIGESKGNLDAIMLRNCKLQQLTSCYKYFKGKNFTTDQREPAMEDMDHLSLRKMKTLNYQSSYSPKESSNDRNRPRLVSREIQESKEGMDDSFSFYLQPEKENTLKKMQSELTKPPSSSFDVFQSSPQLLVIPPAYNQDSPFRKSAPQEVTPPNTDILFPSFLQSSHGRKSIESAAQSDPNKTSKSCQNCTKLQERLDELSGRYTQQRRRWQEQKQASEQANVMEEFARKSRMAELEKMNMQSQAQIKQLQERVDQLVQQRHKGYELLQKTKCENKDLNERLISQTNESIKLSAVIEKERKNVRQAREMCLDANRTNEALKGRVSELQGAISQLGKKEAYWKQINSAQEMAIRECKAKISLLEERNSALQQRNHGLQQQNGNNNKLEALLTEMKVKNIDLEKTITNKDKITQQVNSMLSQKEEVIKGLNQQLTASKRQKDHLQGQMRVLRMSSQARQTQVISLKAYFSKDSSEQMKAHQQQISQYALKIQQLGRQVMGKQDQLQSQKKKSLLLNERMAQLNTKLDNKQKIISKLTEELKMTKLDNQKLQQEARQLRTTIQQLRVCQKKTQQSQMRITDLTNILALKQEQTLSLKESSHMMEGSMQQFKTRLESKQSIINDLTNQLQTTKIERQKLQQQIALLKINAQQLKLSHQNASESFILINQLTNTIISKQNELESLKKSNNLLSMNILELKIQGKKLKEEAVRLKTQKETEETRNKETINQLQESLSALALQIQALKREKQRMQEQVFIIPPQRTSEKSQEQRSSCESLSARESQISMLTELTERQAKVIQQLSREIREIEVSKGMMGEQLASSTLVLRNSQRNMGELQGQVAILRQRNERMMERNDIMTQEVNVLKKQLVLVRSQVENSKNAEIHKLKQALSATQGKHKELLFKFQSISELMMEIQEEKIELADELFILHEFLKKRGISVPK